MSQDPLATAPEGPVRLDEELGSRLNEVESVIRAQAMFNHQAGKVLEPTLTAMRQSGLLAANVPKDAGGWGFGVANGRPDAYWQLVRRIARADTSIGQVFQVHSNSLDVINAVGTAEQRDRVNTAVVAGAVLGAWGSERADSRTTVFRDEGEELVVFGDKAFATNADIASLGFLFAPPEDSTNPYGEVQMMIIDATDERVHIIPEWWDPSLAMRATASHKISFDGLRVPKRDLIGAPGIYISGNYQIRSLCAFASNFLGTIEAIVELVTEALAKRGGPDNVPNATRRIAELYRSIYVLEGLLERTARAFRSGSDESLWLANLYRWVAGEELMKSIDHATVLYGSMALFEDNLFAKFILDAMMYVRHENNDRLAETVGLGALNLDVDYNFSGAKWMSPIQAL